MIRTELLSTTLLLAACASGGSGGTGGSTGTPPFVPAPHRNIPALVDHGGRRMSGMKLVFITSANDFQQPAIQTFGDAVVQSQWVKTVLGPYGIAPPASVVHRSDQPSIEMPLQDSDIRAYIAAMIGDAGPAPDGNTLYVLFLPDSSPVSGPFSGYHSAYPSQSATVGDSYAVVGFLPTYEELSSVDQETTTASHEIIESATDPASGGLMLGPASAQPWTESVWVSLQGDDIETGDLCEGTETYEASADGGYVYQRIFDNDIAEDGGDNPCIPQSTPYYSVSAPQDWYAAAPGSSVAIPISGWSSAATADWMLYPYERLYGPNQGSFGTPTLTTDAGARDSCYSLLTLNNGATATLTVNVPTGAPPGAWSVAAVESFVDGAGFNGCDISRTGDQGHTWLVGVYVPLPDAGPNTLAPSPLSCESLAAAFGSDGDLYELCGADDYQGYLGQLERYSIAANDWSASATLLPGPLASFAAVTGPDGRIYLIGGWDGTNDFANLQAFDTQLQSWRELSGMPTARRGLTAVVGPDHRLYAIGGEVGGNTVGAVEAYDFAAGTWTSAPDLPIPVRGASAAVGSDGQIWVFGGISATDDRSAVQSYNPASETWDAGALALPVARSWGSATADGEGHLVLIGGDNDLGDGGLVAETDIFTPGTGFTTGPPLPTPRTDLAAALGLDGNIYVLGGSFLDGTPTGALSVYSPSCGCFTH